MSYRILCAYDLCAPADGAFAFAVLLCDKLAGELHVLTICEAGESSSGDPWGSGPPAVQRHFAAALARLREQAAAQGVLANVELTTGVPTERIIEVGRQLGVHHIVLGAPRAAWSDSVAQRIAADAHCAVTVVR